MEKEIINLIERKIGYVFKNKELLVQAFTRKSYSEENGGENNEVLEFIGDKALDTVIIKIMIDRFGLSTKDERWINYQRTQNNFLRNKTKEGVLTELKRELVEKKALSNSMEELGLHKYLIMGKGDIYTGVSNSLSVKEDLFESIIGAIVLDSNWNLSLVENSVSLMIDFDKFFNSESEKLDNYIGALQELTQGIGYGVPRYTFKEVEKCLFECSVSIDGFPETLSSKGTSKMNAKKEAARLMFDVFSKSYKNEPKLLMELNRLNEKNASMLFKELIKRGLIKEPVVTEYSKDDHIATIFTVIITDNENNISETGLGRSKKEARSKACLLYLSRIKNIILCAKNE